MGYSTNEEYLTTRRLRTWSNQALDQASKEAMEIAGYVIRAKDGWIVKENADGSIEKIKPVESVELPKNPLFD